MYRNNDSLASAGMGQQYQQSASSTSSFSFSPFSATMQGIMSTNFDSPQHLSPPGTSALPRQVSRSTPERQGHVRNKSGSLSPHMGRSSPLRNSSTPSGPSDRSLPGKDVSAETITDAYVAFILYCNPQIALDADTSTLETNFQSPPKSDNKDFKVYRLFELIRQFDAKEIKTWAQLVMEMGVEAPDTSKGQSVQKVQQYSVRLKRWMRAMHIDAFFEYLLDKQHAYFTDVPGPDEPYAPMRDGVAAEEDLALRALDPDLRPKRGRRRNSEAEADDGADAAKRPGSTHPQSAYPASAYPSSALPMSAHPNGGGDPWAIASAVTPQSFAPWARNPNVPQSAVNPTAPSQLRWQIHGPSQDSSTPHPMTAHPASMNSHIEAAFEGEPKSATPARKRRKHGPAVSSAWNSSGAAGAKPRGRPPASRNLQDGPFTTFPADPANDKGTMQVFQASQAQMETRQSTEEISESVAPAPSQPVRAQSDGPLRRGRLSLQVPAHTGGPVRLATPPRVLVNGETNESESRPLTQSPVSSSEQPLQSLQQAQCPQPRRPLVFAEKSMPGFAYGVLHRTLTSDLLRAELQGRTHRLTSDEARRLASAVLERLNLPVVDGTAAKDDIARLTAASWLGLGEHFNVPLGPATGSGKRISVTRFSIGEDGYEELVSAHLPPSPSIREIFDLSWTTTLGALSGSFSLTDLTLSPSPSAKDEDSHDALLTQFAEAAKVMGVEQPKLDRAMAKVREGVRTGDGGGDGIDWKARYMAMEFSARVAKGELDRVKERMLERVLDAVI